jgi:hypothetical protein
MTAEIRPGGLVVTRIDKGVPRKGIHPVERKTIIKVKKQARRKPPTKTP